MKHPPEPEERAGTDDGPFETLPRQMPRWLQRAMAIHSAADLAVVGVVLVLLAAGTGVWAINAIT